MIITKAMKHRMSGDNLKRSSPCTPEAWSDPEMAGAHKRKENLGSEVRVAPFPICNAHALKLQAQIFKKITRGKSMVL